MAAPTCGALTREVQKFIYRHSTAPSTDDQFNELALRIFSTQYAHNKFYRRYCDLDERTPGNVRSWKNIPAIPSLAFKEVRIAVFPSAKTSAVFYTSGTTEKKQGKHYYETLSLYRRVIPAPFKKYCLPDDAKLSYHFLIPSPREAGHSSLSYMMGQVSRTFAGGRGKFHVSQGMPRYASLARELGRERGKVFLLSTAFALAGFFEYLQQIRVKISLKLGSRIMETGGMKGSRHEMSRASLYRNCETWLGVPRTHVVSEYGMTELTSQYYDTSLLDHAQGTRRKTALDGPAWLRPVVVHPLTGQECRTGEIGILKHVDLANVGSVLAIQTEDLGRRLADERFQMLGRSKTSLPRGCSLPYEELLGSMKS